MTYQMISLLDKEIEKNMKSVNILNTAIETIKKTSTNHIKAFFLFKKNCPNHTIMNVGETTKRTKWQDGYETLEKKRDEKINICRGLLKAIEILRFEN